MSAGITHGARLDRAASATRFAGDGFELGLRHAAIGKRATISTSLRGGVRSLAAAGVTAGRTRATESSGELALSLFPASGTTLGPITFGLTMRAAGTVVGHHLTEPTTRTLSYAFGTATVGPSVRMNRAIGGGKATAQLDVPLAGVVVQSYSAVRSITGLANVDTRWTTLGALRAGGLSLSYEPASRGRWGIVYQYRLQGAAYDATQPVRSLTHALSIGIVWRGGAR
ncbi:MAG TPA: hypothetical protein VFT29_11950 [Gemmatimonadaceae bacterium]|nr:hypothetical protein [Gemmatimonadaceae bacterium]